MLWEREQGPAVSAAASHRDPAAPSAWVERFAPVIAAGGEALDLACGGGRHARLLLALGHPVTALDRDLARLADIDDPRLVRVEADLEAGRAWPLGARRFAGIVVTNYLHRPLFDPILGALAPGGVLIYETFARGNERFGKPSNPDFLLAPGELLALARRGGLRVLAYEDLDLREPRPACVQRICARAPA
jgi:SAM-dependent methyltransferase